VNDADLEMKLALYDALFEELFRSGVLTEDMCERLAARFDGMERYYEGNSRQDHFTRLALATRLLPMRAVADTPSEHRAKFERKQMIERTALLERRAREQGE
jgi:hypothetical protein